MKINDSQLILGYQLRVPIGQLSAYWTRNRRNQYLLEPNIDSPLSVDRTVWPTVDSALAAAALFDDFESGPYQAPNGLSLFRLKKSVGNSIASLLKNGEVIVAIGAEKTIANHLCNKHKIDLSVSDRQPADLSLQFLGFDVCDEWLLSGLMNCGVGADDHATLKERYSAFINKDGLFNNIEISTNYATEMNRHVYEHAPFFPASLFRMILKK